MSLEGGWVRATDEFVMLAKMTDGVEVMPVVARENGAVPPKVDIART
jgi:hypothetical protein